MQLAGDVCLLSCVVAYLVGPCESPCCGAGATLSVLDGALEGWDALDSELREAAGLPSQPEEGGASVRSATQAVVDAVVDLIDGPGNLGCGPRLSGLDIKSKC